MMLERTWGHGLGRTRLPSVAAGRLIAAGSAASKQTAKLLAINPGWLLYPMGSVTTGRARPAKQLGVALPVPIRVPEYRLRHGHSQTDDETHLKCSRSGARASRENCSRNLGPASGAAVCLGDGSTVVDGDTS